MSLVEKYLNHYSENIKLCEEIAELWKQKYLPAANQVVCVPAYREFQSFPNFLTSLRAASKNSKKITLLIVCINERVDSDSDTKLDNLNLQSYFQAFETIKNDSRYYIGKVSDDFYTIVIFAIDIHAFPVDQGVGLARKTTQDLALLFFNKNLITSDLVWMTDSDVEVPLNYFDVELSKNSGAGVFAFSHRKPSLQAKDVAAKAAARHYDFGLRYYVAGLIFAGSAYAFDAMGSCIVYRQKCYAQVRGVPKLLAAEDFYFLNKIRKVCFIEDVNHVELQLSARRSDRVTFGTGAAVVKFAEQLLQGKEYLFYNPMCFLVLKNWLSYAQSLLGDFSVAIENLEKNFTLSENSILYLKNKMQKAVPQIDQPKQTAAKKKAFEVIFDGLFQLQFIHTLRDHDFESVSFNNLKHTKLVANWTYRTKRLWDYDLNDFDS